MPVIFINNSQETFTPTQSGAIATWVWEVCKAAEQVGSRPWVITRDSTAAHYEWPETITVPYPREPQSRMEKLFARADRKVSGHQEFGMRTFADRLIRTIRDRGLEVYPLILHNDLELCVLLRSAFPHATIVSHFHNQSACKKRFFDKLSACCSAITAVSRFTGQWVESELGLAEGTVKTIYNGVDCDRFVPAEVAPVGIPVINFLGRTTPHKGPDLLLTAAHSLSKRTDQFAIQIVGSNFWHKFEEDRFQRSLESQIELLRARNIEVRQTGHLPRSQIPLELQRCRIHTFPSRWDEPFGLATLEGMACGLATVASDTGATPEVIGDAGLLFPRDDAGALADRLWQLISDEELLKDRSQAARKRAEQFTWKAAWHALVNVLAMHHKGPSHFAAKNHPEKIFRGVREDKLVRADI